MQSQHQLSLTQESSIMLWAPLTVRKRGEHTGLHINIYLLRVQTHKSLVWVKMTIYFLFIFASIHACIRLSDHWKHPNYINISIDNFIQVAVVEHCLFRLFCSFTDCVEAHLFIHWEFISLKLAFVYKLCRSSDYYNLSTYGTDLVNESWQGVCFGNLVRAAFVGDKSIFCCTLVLEIWGLYWANIIPHLHEGKWS